MPKANQMYVLLLIIFSFAFAYRLLLLLWSGFPPGADIGLHNSVIYSVTGSGNTDFLYNYYHIGGGISLTFPGYHIFTAGVMLFTGLPEYVAHVAVVALFSALIVVCAFLITKRVFSVSAAYIVAFLAAISRFDIEMLTWAGYPNVITLMLIPLTYYLYLEKDRFTKVPFFVSTSILVGSIFLTHSLSSVMFIAVLAPVVLFVLLWPKAMGTQRRTVLYWVLPMVFGAILVSPFLVQAVPTYLAQYGSAEIDNAAFSRILAYWIVAPLFLIVGAFFAFSTKYYKKLLALPTFLLAMWVFVPLVCTQGYLVGAPVDYNRFLYFLVLPILVFIGVLMDHGAETIALGVEKYRGQVHLGGYKVKVSKRFEGLQRKFENAGHRLAVASTRKRIYSFCILVFLLFSFVALPIFVTPSLNVGETLQSYYQTMDNPKWEATQWLKNNTAPGSVLVADALYGWWLGGFTQRPTLSANDPAYLTVNREVDNASFAVKLLDTDYLIGNNYIQVREDGGYLGRHNPEFILNVTKENYLYPFFNYDNDDTIVTLLVRLPDGKNRTECYSLSDLPVTDMKLENNSNTASTSITHGNNRFNFTQIVTVPLGSQFAHITQKISTDNPDVSLVSIQFGLFTKGYPIVGDDNSYVAFVDEAMKSIGELVFPDQQSRPSEVLGTYSPALITFNLDSEKSKQFSYYMGVYQYSDEQLAQVKIGELSFSKIVQDKSQSYTQTFGSSYFTIFDYHQELVNRKISYVVLAIDDNPIPEKTELDVDAKFRLDPLFSLVFINEEVAIYRVN
jgi:hypothetical protein